MTDLYETLGVEKDATPADIKKAYRRKSKDAHPDAGGSEAAFHSVALAHRILSDEQRREKYDRTGSLDEAVDNRDARAASILQSLVQAFLDDEAAKTRDLVAEMKKQIVADIKQASQSIEQAKAFIARSKDLRGRFKTKKGAPIIGHMIDNKIAEAERVMVNLTEQIDIRNRAAAMLDDHEFKPEPKPQDPWGTGYIGEDALRDQMKRMLRDVPPAYGFGSTNPFTQGRNR
jgi:curved DNA-binding protein CbpA